MSDLPENLQVIKREPSPPSTPEDRSPNDIKAKLNLHVKRRLQDFAQHSEDGSLEICHSSTVNADIKPKLEAIKTETTRQKRPYHKRTEKTPKSTSSATSTSGTTPQRKYKHKLKQIVTTGNPETLTPNSVDEPAINSSTLTAGAISAGDEDDGGHDDLRAAKEKEKCPDVLAMVLSMKKRSLMQDPEVQSFLKDVMEVIKS